MYFYRTINVIVYNACIRIYACLIMLLDLTRKDRLSSMMDSWVLDTDNFRFSCSSGITYRYTRQLSEFDGFTKQRHLILHGCLSSWWSILPLRPPGCAHLAIHPSVRDSISPVDNISCKSGSWLPRKPPTLTPFGLLNFAHAYKLHEIRLVVFVNDCHCCRKQNVWISVHQKIKSLLEFRGATVCVWHTCIVADFCCRLLTYLHQYILVAIPLF